MTHRNVSGRPAAAWLLAPLLPLVPSCSDGASSGSPSAGDSPGTGRIEVLATDAPLPHDLVEYALLRVDLVEIHRAGNPDIQDDEGEWVTLHEGVTFGILVSNLTNGVTEGLVERDLDTGSYDQLRLRIPDAELELVNGNLYLASDGSLNLTSLDTSGLGLHFVPPLQVLDGVSSRVLLDFDLSKMFKPVPASNPLAADSFNLHPAVKVSLLSETGEVRGTVVEDDGGGGLVGVDTASVFLVPPGETDLDSAVSSTATATEGAFAFLGVEPGTYDVIAVRGDLDGSFVAVPVAAGAVSEIEILIE